MNPNSHHQDPFRSPEATLATPNASIPNVVTQSQRTAASERPQRRNEDDSELMYYHDTSLSFQSPQNLCYQFLMTMNYVQSLIKYKILMIGTVLENRILELKFESSCSHYCTRYENPLLRRGCNSNCIDRRLLVVLFSHVRPLAYQSYTDIL
jgi:hypothetical protein